jgi:hypothetical protein
LGIVSLAISADANMGSDAFERAQRRVTIAANP